jgi:hypothetical protein
VSELHPIAKSLLMTIGKIGYKSLCAGVSAGLRGLGEITEEIDKRIKHGANEASRMADGHPYERPKEEERRR